MNHVTYHLGSAGSRIFSLEISKFYTANKILSRDSIYIADVVMWSKFVNSRIFFRFHNLGLALGMTLKF